MALGGALSGGREYVLKIVADVSDAVKGVDTVTNQTTTMRDKMVGIGKSIATGLAVGGVISFGKSVVQAGMDADAGMDAVISVFGEASDSVIDFSKTTADSMGLSAAEYQTMAAKAGNVLTGLGINSDDAAKQTGVLSQRAADLSAIFGGDASEAMNAFEQAMMGQTRGLKKYGLSISNAEVEARALADGNVDAAGKVTEAGKAIATQELILEATAKQAGAYAENSGDLGSQQEILSAKFANLQQTLGTALLPVLEKLITLVQPFIEFISKNTSWLVPLAAGILAVVAAVKIWNAVQLILNATLWANPIFQIVGIIALIVGGIVLLYTKVDWFRNFVDGAIDAIVAAFNWVLDTVKAVFNWIKTNWPLLLAILTGPIGLAVKFIVDYWDAIKNGLSTAIDAIKGFFQRLPEQIKNFLAPIVNIITWPYRTAFDAILTVANTVKDWFWSFPGKVRTFFSGMADIISAPFRIAFDAVKKLWNNTVGGFGFTIPSWVPGVGGKSFKIPSMASGGIVTRPTIALIGEAGPEAVIPLSSSGIAATKTVVINVYALTANAEVGRRVYEALREYDRTSGKEAFAS